MFRFRYRCVSHLPWLMTCLLFALVGRAAAQPIDPNEAAIRMLRQTVTPQRDGSHLSRLFALRQLRDPELRPFFTALVKSSQWQQQVHAVLGLAELDANTRVDSSLISQMDAQAQDAVIATALDLKLFAPEEMMQLLGTSDLPAMAQLLLLAELVAPPVSSGEPANQNDSTETPTVDTRSLVPELRIIADSKDDHIASLASCLLVQLGQGDSLATVRTRMSALADRRQLDLQLWLLEGIRRYRLAACVEWVKEIVNQPSADSDLVYRSVFTLLDLDPPTGLAMWAKQMQGNPTYQQRVRYCTSLLASTVRSPASTYDLLKPAADEELLIKMIAVGKALSSQADPTTALIQLLDLNHVKITDWAMEQIRSLPNDQAARVYSHLIDRIGTISTPSSEQVALAVTATARLFAIDPEAALARLRQAEDDSTLQQAILLGLFEASSPKVGEAAGALRRIGSGRADSLALLLMAKYSNSLPRADVDQLGKIASGGGLVSDVLQVQAAWMYLKHTNQTQSALTTLFAAAN